MAWSRDRREDLETLLHLLRKCRDLNSSNHVIANLKYVIEVADALTSFNATAHRKSFTQFLVDEATANTEKKE